MKTYIEAPIINYGISMPIDNTYMVHETIKNMPVMASFNIDSSELNAIKQIIENIERETGQEYFYDPTTRNIWRTV